MAMVNKELRNGKLRYSVFTPQGFWLGTFRCKATAEEVARQYNCDVKLNRSVLGL